MEAVKAWVKSWGSKVLVYVFMKYIAPAIEQEMKEFAKSVVNSGYNSVNDIDVKDVVDEAKFHFISQLKGKL